MNGTLSVVRQQTWLVTALALVVLIGVNAYLQPNLFQPNVLRSNLATFLPLILVAIGQTYVVLAGDIDLSVGSIAALVNVVTVTAIAAIGESTGSVLAGCAVGLAVGVLCGLANGFFIALLRFQPIVTTFATGIIFAGIALWVLPQAGMPVPAMFWRSYGGAVLGVPVVVLILIGALLVVTVIGRRPFQKRLKAVGGLRQAAFQTGIAVARIRVTAYVLSGLFAALAALCLTGETASGDPLLGQRLALASVSAVVLGGTALSGGSGGAVGSVLGALVVGMIGNVIFFARLPFEYQTLVQGLIVLAALAGGVFLARR